MKVLISLRRRTDYTTTVEMDDARFNRLSAELDSAESRVRKKAEKEINALVKPDDWQDDELDYIDSFEEETTLTEPPPVTPAATAPEP